MMKPILYRQKWHKLRESKVDAAALRQLARQIAFSFTDQYFQRGEYQSEYIDLLCEMATFYSQNTINDIAAKALFELVVETVGDEFEDFPPEVYCRLTTQIIAHGRSVPAGRNLDSELADLGLLSTDHLYRRALAVQTRLDRYRVGEAPSSIVLLSHGTIGADVAILSVMIQRLGKLFGQTPILIVDSAKLQSLFDGVPSVRIVEPNHARRDGLFERLGPWHATLEILRDETPDGGRGRTLIIDADSPVCLHGVLPLSDEDNYLFFNTRGTSLPSTHVSLAERTNAWMDGAFGVADFCCPQVWMPRAVMETASVRTDMLRATGAQRLVAVNFGTGQHPRKRINLEFEKRLIRALAAVPGTVVILDRGFGPDEVGRSMQLVGDIRGRGLPCLETQFGGANFPAIAHGVIVVESTIGQMAALIAHSDEYIGYDSAFQHIAAATKTPTTTIFAGSNNTRFVRQWSAYGDTECRIVHIDTLADPSRVDLDEAISRVVQDRPGRTRRRPGQRIDAVDRRRHASRPTPERVEEKR